LTRDTLRTARRAAAAVPAAVLAASVLYTAGASPAAAGTLRGDPRSDVIVTMTGPDPAAAQRQVVLAGGRVGTLLPIVHGFTATVPVAALPALAALPGVRSVTPNASGHLLSIDPDLGYDPAGDEGALPWIADMLNVRDVWNQGITGAGVDVALVDSGVAPVPGLDSGNVVDGPDLSFESQHADVRYLDTFGHGTHMASIIAGRDTAGTPASYADSGHFTGIAPDARVISLKVAAADGSADVSQVIAAIDWVTQHAHTDGLNIRVLNLSYGTDSTQGYQLDPLAYAVEQAWQHGIVVVVAAGNDGTNRAELANPATDPYVVAVGADDPHGTLAVNDDTVPAFAQRGTTARRVDVIAPGVHVLGLRDPNSYVDQNNPAGRVGSRFIRGSGTSQATAVASGVAALIAQKYPTATPDQVKYLLRSSAQALPAAPDIWVGLGVLDAATAVAGDPANAPAQSFPAAGGDGTLEGARGSSHVALDNVTLTGEQDIFGQQWGGAATTNNMSGGLVWSGGRFNGRTWTGDDWDADGGWTATSWSAADWTGSPWSSRTWVSRTWVDNSWDSRTWVDCDWSSRTWVSRTWVNSSWAGATWS
jgi:serine protease AprX